MNIFTIFDEILSDYASPKVRRLIHLLLLLAAAITAIVLAVDGDWKQAILAVLAALYAGANKANTGTEAPDSAGVDTSPDDGLSYGESGGQPFPQGN